MAVELVSKDVLYAALHKQKLSEETGTGKNESMSGEKPERH